MSDPNSFSKALLNQQNFEILSKNTAYKRYIQVEQRLVKFPDGREISWDVVGHNHTFVCIMPYDIKTKTTSLIKEYAQGLNREIFSFACGGFEPSKHKNCLEAAKAELSEEAGLKDGTWVELIKHYSKSEGISEVKWSTNVFFPYLVLDPEHDANPGLKDPEELITVFHSVTLEDVEQLIMEGKLVLPSVQTFFMSLKYLRDNALC